MMMNWSHVSIFLLLCTSCALSETVFANRKNVIVMSPSTIFAQQTNLFRVRAYQPSSKVYLTTVVEGSPKLVVDQSQYPLSYISDGNYGVDIPYRSKFIPADFGSTYLLFNFTAQLCANSACTETNSEEITESIRLVTRPLIILSETDKPIYRPGESVRARFLALGPALLDPLNPLLDYPDKKLIKTENGSMNIVDLTTGDIKSLQSSDYEEIFLIDSKGNRVKQWFTVSPHLAANLSYELLADAPEGTWSITAKQLGHSESITFSVKHYVLPRFVISVNAPTNLSLESNYTQFTVCAKYTDGPPMLGSVRSLLCVCNKPYKQDEEENLKRSILESPKCPQTYGIQVTRPCVQTIGVLQRSGCADFNVSTSGLGFSNPQFDRWGQSVFVCAEVEEEGTKSNVSKCESGPMIERKQAQLKLNLPAVYRSKLPLSGSVQLENYAISEHNKTRVRLTLTERSNECGWYIRKPSSDHLFKYSATVLLNSNGSGSFTLPPISAKRTISVKAMVISPPANTSIMSGRQKRSIRWRPWRPLPSREDNLVAFTSLRPFKSPVDIFVQTWPTETLSKVVCPGTVTVRLLANTPLSNETIHIESLVKGQLLHQVIRPVSTEVEPCIDQSGPLGHYNCLARNSTEIKCHDGWTGENCLKAVCSRNCNLTGGTCDDPNICVCNDGWKGQNCDECVRLDGCVHGKCVEGDDCVCDPGWAGYLCDMPEIVHEQIPEEGSVPRNIQTDKVKATKENGTEVGPTEVQPRRTLYEREIEFEIDETWGPEATAVVYFYTDNVKGREIISSIVNLEGIENCSSPAIAHQTSNKESGLLFSNYQPSPGQAIQMTLSLSGLEQTQLSSTHNKSNQTTQGCFVRLSDLSLTNFEGPNNLVNLKKYSELLKSVYRVGQWRPKEASSMEETFQAAGIQIKQSKPQEMVYEADTICPRFAYMSHKTVEHPSKPQAFREKTTAEEENAWTIHEPRPRLRDFFPEVWFFDVEPLQTIERTNGLIDYRVVKSLTAPDSITSWRSSAFCTTPFHGLWIPQEKHLTVTMPFFVELTLPRQVKRGEILYLPVSVFVKVGNDRSSVKACSEVQVETIVDQDEWLRVGSSSYTGCVCEGEKHTFQLGLLAKRLGSLNVTARATATLDSPLCNDHDVTRKYEATQSNSRLSDMIRRPVRVVPEGIPQESTFGGIVCIPSNETQVEQTFALIVPTNVISGSLRMYLSYTDEVLGPALNNLDRLVALPIGCGEQNMLLVAPNVYVLDYLQTAPVVNERETDKLIHTARSHIASGYQQQLKYRRADGSYSAFGQSDAEGSTWLTAFVLRVFAKAYNIDSNLLVDWSRLFNETVSFLTKRRSAVNSGCFIEKGRVFHTAMQGGLGSSSMDSKELLLTAYVLSAIREIGPAANGLNTDQIKSIIDDGRICLDQLLRSVLGMSEKLDTLSTYALAQLTYTVTSIDPQNAKTQVLRNELLRRKQTVTTGGGSLIFWTSQNEIPAVSQKKADTVDIETTSYAYLALAQDRESFVDLFPIIRWLSSQQTSTGGFSSTQDTVLALEVIADGAKRLGLNRSTGDDNDLALSAHTLPVGHVLHDIMKKEKRRIINQYAFPYTDPNMALSTTWNLTTGHRSGTSCMAVQTVMYYNLPNPNATSSDMTFQLTANVAQQSFPSNKNCTKATVTVCLRPSDNPTRQKDTGMLLIRTHMVSGWEPLEKDILNQVGSDNELPKRVDFDEDSSVSLYFDGFTENEAKLRGGWSSLKRCAQVNLLQKLFMQDTQSATISAMDYYDTDRTITATYSLDECKSAWGIDDSPPVVGTTTTTVSTTTDNEVDRTTEQPLICSTCEINMTSNETLAEFIFDSVCKAYENLYLIRINSKSDDSYHVTATTIQNVNYTASWNASLLTNSKLACNCSSIRLDSKLLVISSGSTNVYTGMPSFSLPLSKHSSFILPISDALPSIEAAAQRWSTEQSSDDERGSRWGCERIKGLYRYVRVKFL